MTRKLRRWGDRKLAAQNPLNQHLSHKAVQGRDFSNYSNDPIAFCHEVLEVPVLTREQQSLLLSIRDNRITNCQAANSVGKTFVISCAVLHHVFAKKALCFTTAPSLQQTKDLLWREIRVLYDRNKHKLGGLRGELFVKLSEEAKAIGFTAKHTDAASFQGRHSFLLLLVIDESDGISPIIDEAFESCLTGSQNRGVRIGNPLNPGSAFAKACAISHMKIPAFSHPNVAWAYDLYEDGIHRLKPEVAAQILKPPSQQKDDPVKPQEDWNSTLPRDLIPGAISIRWIEMARVKYGEKSVFWQSRIEANFPSDAIDGIISSTLLGDARFRYDCNPQHWDMAALQYGWVIAVDVADRVDRHAIALWRGKVLYQVKIIETIGDDEDISRLELEVKKTAKRFGDSVQIVVDRVGVGAGLLSSLKVQGYRVQGCAFGEKADDKEAFNNKKVELYWRFREGLRSGELAIAPMGEVEEIVFEELMAIRYNTNTEKQIICEPKEKVRSRIGRSPDGADAVVMGLQVQPFLQSQQTPLVVIGGQQDDGEGVFSSGSHINFGWRGEVDFPG
jgi:hypothetical protein